MGRGGSISTQTKNVGKARIALFGFGESNVEFECDPLFSTGSVATIVNRNGQATAFHNMKGGLGGDAMAARRQRAPACRGWMTD